MKRSNKGEAPQTVVDWIRSEELRLGQKPPFESLQRPEKDHLRGALLREQGYLCTYCGRSLASDFSDSHIDHFWPQAEFNGTGGRKDLRLDHNNLFQSCGPSSLPGGAARDLPNTCGSAKRNWYDEEYSIVPSEENCEERFMYDGAGQIAPSNSLDHAGINMINSLNLHDPALNYHRKKIVQELEEVFLSMSPSLVEVQNEISRWLQTDDAGRLSGFSQVARRYLGVEIRGKE